MVVYSISLPTNREAHFSCGFLLRARTAPRFCVVCAREASNRPNSCDVRVKLDSPPPSIRERAHAHTAVSVCVCVCNRLRHANPESAVTYLSRTSNLYEYILQTSTPENKATTPDKPCRRVKRFQHIIIIIVKTGTVARRERRMMHVSYAHDLI